MTAERIVLTVDDEEPILRLLRVALSDLPCRSVQATSGEDAIEIARQERPDVLITDLRLPGMSGVELISRMKGGGLGDVPVILISAHAEPAEHEADHFMAKPLDLDELVTLVDSYMRDRDVDDGDTGARRGGGWQ